MIHRYAGPATGRAAVTACGAVLHLSRVAGYRADVTCPDCNAIALAEFIARGAIVAPVGAELGQ